MASMARRKGEQSRAEINAGWPHQVAVEARLCSGEQYMTKHMFCLHLNLCPRGHTFRRGDTDYVVFCFAESCDADRFIRKFGGTLYDAHMRPRWK